MRFTNQIAVIFGAGRGIGKAIATRLSSEGAKLIIADILIDEIEQVKQQILDTGGSVEAYTLDISDEKKSNQCIQKIFNKHKKIDILINTVGIVGPSSCPIENYDLEDFIQVINVNLTGAFIVSKAVIPIMKKLNYGRILHIASIAGKEGNPGMVGYTASKAALIGMVKGLGKELAETNITVNGVAPGLISSEMNSETDPEMLSYMINKIPMKRPGTVDEVAALALWIVSEEASFNTGSIFDISGGRATY
ncbi:MAG: SDR family oxidoreductase [Flavobacteriaceae bacterium]|nr:SDR family oxidoreductase [Flavobacteriaceae bacterium]